MSRRGVVQGHAEYAAGSEREIRRALTGKIRHDDEPVGPARRRQRELGERSVVDTEQGAGRIERD